MKALRLDSAGFDNFGLAEIDAPRPGAGEVLLKMSAAGVLLRDYKVVSGAYAAAEQTWPLIPGSEGVGEIVELGEGVDRSWTGKRVNPVYVQGWQGARPHPQAIARGTLGGPLLHGCFAEYLTVPVAGVVEVPAHLSHEEAACLPFSALTAWSAVVDQAGIARGDVVMIQGTGGIALFALQFAKWLGARVIVSSKNDEKLARARALGADHVINYASTPQWAQAVLDLTEGRGADLVMDPGGTVTMLESIRAVRPCGTVSVFNALSSAELGVQLPYLLGHNIALHGVNAGSREAHVAMVQGITQANLHPVLERSYAFEDGVAAVANAPKAEQFGKVCLRI